MELEALSASLKTRSKGSSGQNFTNDSAAGPIMMVTWLLHLPLSNFPGQPIR